MNGMTTVLDTTTVPGTRLLYRLALLLAAVSGAFCIILCVVLAVNYHGLLSPSGTTGIDTETLQTNDPSYRQPAEDSFNRLPTDDPSFLALRQILTQNRQDEALKTQIRELDLELRNDYFQRRSIIKRTIHFLILSSILFFVAVRTISVLNRQIPRPNDEVRKSEEKESWGVTVVTVWLMLCVGLYLGLLLVPPTHIDLIYSKLEPSAPTAPGESLPPPSALAGAETLPDEIGAAPMPAIELTEELLAKNWVSFRNFDGNGIGFSDNPPTQWNGRTGENIIWQSEVPLPGNSSPVIWTDESGGGKLFLTGADEDSQKIFCYDITNGELLWEADVTRPEAKITADQVDHDTGFAAPTPVVDGRHVYAMFANGELVAVNFDGTFVWRHSFGIPDNSYGFASSPALYFDKLIVQFDDGEGESSKLIAFNRDNGDVLWKTAREAIPNSWASPTIKKIGDSYQIIACGNPYVIAYNPEDGTEIWRCRCLSGDVGPSAVAFENAVLITNEFPRTTTIDATGSGDVTATHILWVGINATPNAVSPLMTEEYFLTLDAGGFLTGYDPTVLNPTNKRARFWELEVGDMVSLYSSPILVGTYLYVFDKTKDNARSFVIDLSKVAVGEDGRLTEESEQAMIVSENPMPEPVVTSPAMLNDRLYIRSTTKIYCIGDL